MSDAQQDELAAVRHEAQRLLREQVQAERLEALLDVPGSFDQALWQLVSEQGWPAVSLAEQDGGAGLGWGGVAVLAEEVGRTTAALPLVAGALAAAALAAGGDAAARERWLPRLADGAAKACLVLPALRHGRLRDGTGLSLVAGRVTGTVSTVAFGAAADVAVAAVQDEQQRTVLVLIDLAAAQVRREAVRTIDDVRGFATLTFEAAPAALVGDAAAVAALVDRAAALTAFEQLGGAQASLALAIEHALQREAFGQPIARFQAIKHKLVEMYGAIEIARGCALTALELITADGPAEERHHAAATARIGASQAYEQAARDCINVFGALGVTREAVPHRHYRRARTLALELGSVPAWRESLVTQFIARTVPQEN